MYKYCFIFFYRLSLCWLAIISISSLSYAQDYNERPVILDDHTASISIGENAYILYDNDAQMSIQDIIAQYNSGRLKAQSGHNTIGFPETSDTAGWLIVPIENRSNKDRWFLDFGKLADGRSGLLNSLLVFEANQRDLQFSDSKMRENYKHRLYGNGKVRITLPAQKRSLLIIYLMPQDYKSFNVVPSIKAEPFNVTYDNDIASFLTDNFSTITLASTLIILIGFLITMNIGFLPIIIYYALIYIWVTLFERPIVSDLLNTNLISPLLPVLTTGLISLSAISIIPNKAIISIFKRLIIYMLLILLLLTCFFLLFSGIQIPEKSAIIMMISLMCVIVAVVYLLKTYTGLMQHSIYALTAWIMCYIIGEVTTFLASNNILTVNFYTIQANWLVIYPQFIFVTLGVYLAIQSYIKTNRLAYDRQIKKAETIVRAKKNKESQDHSRLLRVIEREREIMEELRGRESERTEEMRKAKITADEANQAKSAFLAVVSHEIRTPMTGVMGMIRMLEDTDLNQEQKSYLTTIKESGDSMLALLNDILDFSKIEGAGLQLEHIEFDLNRILNGVIMLMKGHADQKQVLLKLNIADDVPTSLYGDPTRLRQVLLNLVSNALKFTSKGRVTVIVKYDESDTGTHSNQLHHLYFAIEDTGIGISEEAKSNIFTPFSQADSSISRKYGGTGLGLNICKTIVTAMGGNINVHSQEGVGTTFYFTIPFTATTDQNKEVDNESSDSNSLPPSTTSDSKNILVIDDNHINQKVMIGFLKKQNHKIDVAGNAKETLNILEDNTNFDVVFMDIEMPDISGLELAAKILESEKSKHLSLIAMTGNVGEDDIKTYYEAGFKGHLPKPIEPEMVNRIIDSLSANIIPFEDWQSISQHANGEDTSEAIPSTKAKYPSAKKSKPRALGKTLDEKMLLGLKEGIGSKQTQELTKDLFKKAEEIHNQMTAAINDNDRPAIKARAHELKGMCSNFGLTALSEKASEIETINNDPERNTNDIQPHIEDLSTLIDRSKFAVNEFLDK